MNKHSLCKFGLILLLASFLAACGTTSPIVSDDDYEYVATVDIGADTTAEQIEAEYGGTVVMHEAEEGFAVLGFNQQEGALTTLTKSKNKQAYNATVLGNNAWASGHSAWAGGHSAWAGGFDAWAGGVSTRGNISENKTAWNLIGLKNAHQRADDLGEDIVVAVIDTGVDVNHTALKNNLVNKSLWKDFVNNDSNPSESGGKYYGHGTAVAGIILQIAPKAKIMPIRVLNGKGQGNLIDVAKGVKWALDNGADVINLSIGSRGSDKLLERYAELAKDKNVSLVVSAGNDGKKDQMTYPANRSTGASKMNTAVVSVGSVSGKGKRSSFSNYGRDLELVAPGQNIVSAYPGNKKASFSGTSFAAPVVTGSIALGLSEDIKYVPTKLKNQGDKEILIEENGTTEANSLGKLLDLDRFTQAFMNN